ncbi:MAG TPA: hypothetical protein PKI33_11495, partial [Anaerolineales bacterium]|nr:hypothetical protein [Anaerolineales bacterium]
MFTWTYRKEVVTRIILITMVLVNAVVPTVARANSASEVENNGSAKLIPPSSVPPVQPKIYYEPEETTLSNLQFSSDETEDTNIPQKDIVEFSIFASQGELSANGLITINVRLRNNGDTTVKDLSYFDKLKDIGSFQSSTDKHIEFNTITNTVIFTLESLAVDEEILFTYDVKANNFGTNSISIHTADIEYTYEGEEKSASASMAIAENSPFVNSDSRILLPDQAGDGWSSSGQVSLYMGDGALTQDAVVVVEPEKLPGEGPELQFNLDVLQTASQTKTSDGEIKEQDAKLLKETKVAFEEPVYLEINFDDVIDLSDIPADQEPYVATFDEGSGVWVKVPIVTENAETNSVVVEAAHFSTWGAGLGNSLPKNGANVL